MTSFNCRIYWSEIKTNSLCFCFLTVQSSYKKMNDENNFHFLFFSSLLLYFFFNLLTFLVFSLVYYYSSYFFRKMKLIWGYFYGLKLSWVGLGWFFLIFRDYPTCKKCWMLSKIRWIYAKNILSQALKKLRYFWKYFFELKLSWVGLVLFNF